MQPLGVGAALLVLPRHGARRVGGVPRRPASGWAAALNTADNAFSYSINQSAKEALYTPTTPDEKYKAKAFIDMFVQRFAKTLGVGRSLGMGRVVRRLLERALAVGRHARRWSRVVVRRALRRPAVRRALRVTSGQGGRPGRSAGPAGPARPRPR